VLDLSPLVSVVVPTYKRPAFLREALQSVLEQSVADIEVLVGDDGDEGRLVVEELGDERISYVANQPRLGPGANYNALLDRARGKLLAPLNDDDRYVPGFLAECIRKFEEMPDLGLVFTNHWIDDGQHIRPRLCPLPGGLHEGWLVDFLKLNPVPFSASLLRREAWELVRPLPAVAPADFVLFARIVARETPCFYIDSPLMIYRAHPGGFSQGRGHRVEAVVAWDSLAFDHGEAELLRRRGLALALVDRAALLIQEGEVDSAARDLRRAWSLDRSLSARRLLMSVLAASPPLARTATRLAKWRRIARTRIRGSADTGR
jgi:glycosyltransferase involved in cell wall biosynthesis